MGASIISAQRRGTTATADVTLVASTGGKMDGQSKDCTRRSSNNHAYLTVGRSGLDTS